MDDPRSWVICLKYPKCDCLWFNGASGILYPSPSKLLSKTQIWLEFGGHVATYPKYDDFCPLGVWIQESIFFSDKMFSFWMVWIISDEVKETLPQVLSQNAPRFGWILVDRWSTTSLIPSYFVSVFCISFFSVVLLLFLYILKIWMEFGGHKSNIPHTHCWIF